jgi:dissimilatory sulfite reductase (desulfoviridin) alpha/beta subunit
MSVAAENLTNSGRVHLVLKASADQLTGQDLLRITEIAEQGNAEVHISHGTWQVLVGVPKDSQHDVTRALREIGYECDIHQNEFSELPHFLLRKGLGLH